MRLADALKSAIEFLGSNAVGSPRLNAEVLMMFTLGVDRAYLYAHPERELTSDEQARYDDALQQRARGIPSQYITGHQEFWGLDLIVNPAVLIPRPETEHVVETVLDLAQCGNAHSARNEALRLLDVGTGSGAIALALAHELPRAVVTAVDVSPEALEVARANVARLQLESRVRFLQSDLLTALSPDDLFDIIASNPPYVGLGEEDKVQREVKKFEPKIAVFAGEEGLDVIARLIPQAHMHLVPGGWLVIEVGYTQSQRVMAMLEGWADVHTVPDLQGIPRVVVARKA